MNTPTPTLFEEYPVYPPTKKTFGWPYLKSALFTKIEAQSASWNESFRFEMFGLCKLSTVLWTDRDQMCPFPQWWWWGWGDHTRKFKMSVYVCVSFSHFLVFCVQFFAVSCFYSIKEFFLARWARHSVTVIGLFCPASGHLPNGTVTVTILRCLPHKPISFGCMRLS